MFGFPRVARLVAGRAGGQALIDLLLGELARFTGPDWEQEDDITMVALQRAAAAGAAPGYWRVIAADEAVEVLEPAAR